ncbi:hypothetical protein SNK03_011322 [Fusarium graminearum]
MNECVDQEKHSAEIEPRTERVEAITQSSKRRCLEVTKETVKDKGKPQAHQLKDPYSVGVVSDARGDAV